MELAPCATDKLKATYQPLQLILTGAHCAPVGPDCCFDWRERARHQAGTSDPAMPHFDIETRIRRWWARLVRACAEPTSRPSVPGPLSHSRTPHGTLTPRLKLPFHLPTPNNLSTATRLGKVCYYIVSQAKKLMNYSPTHKMANKYSMLYLTHNTKQVIN